MWTRRRLRLALAALAVLLALGGAAVGAVVWRLRQGPVPLDLLVPHVTAALAEQAQGWRVDLDALELAWNPSARHAELRARGFRMARPEDGAEVRLDGLRVGLRRRALLRGAIVVTAIEVDGPTLRLVRDAGGHLAVERGAADGGDLDWLWTMMQRLERVAIRNGAIHFVDEATRAVWSLPAVDGEAWRTAGPVRVQLATALVADGTTVPLHLEAVYKPEPGTLSVQASSPGAETAAAFAAWPASLASKAHEWVTTNLSAGRIGPAVVALDGHVVRDGRWKLAVDRLGASVAFSGLAVRYVRTMPAVEAVAGRAEFSADGVDIAVDAGRLAGLDVRPGRVRIAWPAGAPARIAIAATARGPLADLLGVLEHEPVALGERLPFRSADVTGTAAADVRFAFPLEGRIGRAGLGLRGRATVTDASVARVAGAWDVGQGTLAVAVTDRAAAVDGTTAVQGVPVRLRVRDQLRRPGRRRLHVAARLDAGARATLGLDPGTWLAGPVDATVRLASDGRRPAVLGVAADLAPAAVTLPALAVAKPPGEPGRAVARLAVAAGTVTAVERFRATAGGVTVRGGAARAARGGAWQRVDATAAFALADRPADPPAVGLALRRLDPAAPWRVALESGDVGGWLRVYGYEHVRGGRLVFDGTAALGTPGPPLDGVLAVEKVTLGRVPWLVQLVSLASVRGLLDLGSDQAVEVDRLVATIAHRPPATVEIRDLVARGPKMSLKLAGTVDTAADAVALEGTLIPSYYLLNEGADRIPVIGGIVAYATGGAVQAVTFTVSGPRAAPDVAVQPLSSLAPGVLRDWLRKLGL